MLLVENSMYKDPAGRAAIVANKPLVVDLFFMNFLGFVGLYALNDSRGYMKTFEQTEKKLMINEIGDDNHDVSLIVKLAVDAGVLTEARTTPLTRFLALIKKRSIKAKDIDSVKIREMIEATQLHAKPMNSQMRAIVQGFMSAQFDVKEFSRLAYDISKKAEWRDYTLEFRTLIIKGQYTDYFTVMKRAAMAAPASAPAVATTAPINSPAQANTPASAATPAAPPALPPLTISAGIMNGYGAYISWLLQALHDGYSTADITKAVNGVPDATITAHYLSSPAAPDSRYDGWAENLLVDKVLAAFTRTGKWAGLKAQSVRPALAAAVIGRVLAAAKSTKGSPADRANAVEVYNYLATLVPGYKPIAGAGKMPTTFYKDLATLVHRVGFFATKHVADAYFRSKEQPSIFFESLAAAMEAQHGEKWGGFAIGRIDMSLPWYCSDGAELVRQRLLSGAQTGSDANAHFIYLPPATAAASTISELPALSYKWVKDAPTRQAANQRVLDVYLDWLLDKNNAPTSSVVWTFYQAVGGAARAYIKELGGSARATAAMSKVNPAGSGKDHNLWLHVLNDKPVSLTSAECSTDAMAWVSNIASVQPYQTAMPPGTSPVKISMSMSRKPSLAELNALTPDAVAEFMSANFNEETTKSIGGKSHTAKLIDKLYQWDPFKSPVTPQLSTEDSKLVDSLSGDALLAWGLLQGKMAAYEMAQRPAKTVEIFAALSKFAKVTAAQHLKTGVTAFLTRGENKGASSWAAALDMMPLDTAGEVSAFVDALEIFAGNRLETYATDLSVNIAAPFNESRVRWLFAVTSRKSSAIRKAQDTINIGTADGKPSASVAEFVSKFGGMGKTHKLILSSFANNAEELALSRLGLMFGENAIIEPVSSKVREEWRTMSSEKWREVFNKAIDKYGLSKFNASFDWVNEIVGSSEADAAYKGWSMALANDLTPAQVTSIDGPIRLRGYQLRLDDLESPLSDGAKAALEANKLHTAFSDSKWIQPIGSELREWAVANTSNATAAAIIPQSLRWLVENNISTYIDELTELRSKWPAWRAVAIADYQSTFVASVEYESLIRDAWNLDDAGKAVIKSYTNPTSFTFFISSNNIATKLAAEITKIPFEELKTYAPQGVKIPFFISAELMQPELEEFALGLFKEKHRDPMVMLETIGKQDVTSPSSVAYFDIIAKAMIKGLDAGMPFKELSTHQLDIYAKFIDASTIAAAGKKTLHDAIRLSVVNRVASAIATDIEFMVTKSNASYAKVYGDPEVLTSIVKRLAVSTSKSAENALTALAYRTRTDPSNMTPSADFIAAVRAAGKERAVLNRIVKINGTELALSQMTSDPMGVKIDLDAKRAVEFFRYNDIDIASLKVAEVKKFEDMASIGGQVFQAVPPLPLKEISSPETNKSRIRELHRANRYNHSPALGLEVKRTFQASLPGQKDRYDAWLAAHPTSKVMTLYHGTGTIAAQFLLRYGFRIIKSTDGSVTGRMLGDGIYFADNVNKSMLYMSNSGYIRQPNQEGYVFKCRVALGKSPKDYREGAASRNLVSNEWAVFNIDQILIEEVYYGVSRTRDSIRQMLNEAPDQYGSNTSTFIFMDGMVPVAPGKYVPFEDALETLPPHAYIETSAVGPIVTIRHDKTFDEMQGCYRYAEDIVISGDEAAFFALMNNTY